MLVWNQHELRVQSIRGLRCSPDRNHHPIQFPWDDRWTLAWAAVGIGSQSIVAFARSSSWWSYWIWVSRFVAEPIETRDRRWNQRNRFVFDVDRRTPRIHGMPHECDWWVCNPYESRTRRACGSSFDDSFFSENYLSRLTLWSRCE